jgi:hypothetical protein
MSRLQIRAELRSFGVRICPKCLDSQTKNQACRCNIDNREGWRSAVALGQADRAQLERGLHSYETL